MFAGGGSKQQQQWQQLGDLLGELVAAFRWERFGNDNLPAVDPTATT
jgi:hypothetical protein